MERTIAKILLDIGAVSLRVDPPFTWASGRLAPIYCDNRLLLSDPVRRRTVARALADLIERSGFQPEVIAGTATAGIPHAAWLADLLELPMVYVRAAAKAHGKENLVEGRLERGQKVVLIEDLVSTGVSSVAAAKGLVSAGAELLGVVAIFSYGLETAAERFGEAGIPYRTLTSFDVLLREALERGVLTPASKAILADWQKDPSAWSVTRGGAA